MGQPRRQRLAVRDDVRISFFDPLDLVDLRDDDIGQGPLILDVDEQKNIRLPETRMGLFDTGQLLQ